MKLPMTLVAAASLAACGGPEPAATVRESSKPTPPVAASPAPPAATSAPKDCPATVRTFLQWYYQNQERLATYVVLSYPQSAAAAFEVPPGHVSKSGRYELNEPGLAQYIGLLDSTGFFSASFLANKKQELARKAGRLTSFRPDDGPPPGFDADLLFYSQELYEPEDLGSLRLKPGAAAGQSAVVVLPIMDRRWEFTVAQQSAGCVITAIAFK